MNGGDRLLGSADRMQQRSRWLGFPFAVIRKFTDDKGAALIISGRLQRTL